ncbi:MAG: hypothetical protein RL676_483 [Pseudomonadota bacterium]
MGSGPADDGGGALGSQTTMRTDQRVGVERLDFTSVAITPCASGASCGGVMFRAACPGPLASVASAISALEIRRRMISK